MHISFWLFGAYPFFLVDNRTSVEGLIGIAEIIDCAITTGPEFTTEKKRKRREKRRKGKKRSEKKEEKKEGKSREETQGTKWFDDYTIKTGTMAEQRGKLPSISGITDESTSNSKG